MAKVSVIVPVYNSEKYLEDCLTSIVEQSFRDIEIICINDGSVDGSLNILNDFAAKDSRIIVINQPNSGAAIARNTGLECACGDYISIVDSDDYFDTKMLETLYENSEKNNSDILITNSYDLDNETQEKTIPKYHLKLHYLPEDKNIFCYKDISQYVFNFTIGWAWDKFYRRDFLQKNNLRFQNIKNTEDAYFSLISLVKADKISVLNKPLVTHRINTSSSLSANLRQAPFCFIEAIEYMHYELIKMQVYNDVKQSFINWVVEHSVWQWRMTQNEDVRKKLKNEVFPKFKINELPAEYFYDKIAYKRMLDI